MSLSDIRLKILNDAQKEADSIRSCADEEAQKIVAEAHEKAKEQEEIIEKKGGAKIDQMRKKVESLAQHQEKSEILATKRRKISEVFHKAKKELQNMPEVDKERILVSMLDSIDDSQGTIHPSKGDKQLLVSAMRKAKKSFDVSDEIDGMGGFFLVTPDYEIDYRFDCLIDRELSQQLEKKIAEILFGANIA
jgi:V/A-type H+-transporting ATPase subunit E